MTADDIGVPREQATRTETSEFRQSRDPWRTGTRPDLIGRYRILDVLGSGGMGTVFRAHDPQLDREVALKLLHADRIHEGDSTRARARLQREARAIAQVKHPNVIHVYDVGTVEHGGHEQVYVAMELVEGRSLRAWLEQLHSTSEWSRGRSVARIVDVMAQAARGLAAAHRAGLVHRDFKPDNALLGDDGIVRVVDFGLARRADLGTDSITAMPTADPDIEEPGSIDERITRTGATLGTPAYMAPEQFRGEPVDGRTDQFAFCLALFEALYGARAFPRGGRALAVAVIDGNRRAFPSRPPVPSHLRALLERGLTVDPAGRYPSMDALVEALVDDPSGRRRERLRWVFGALVGVSAAGAVFALRSDPPPADDMCGHGHARLEAVWNPEREAGVAQALSAEGLPYAAHVAEGTRAALGAYALEWDEAYRQTCEATHVRHEQTGALLDRRMACLDRRLVALEASVELLTTVEPEQVEHALELTRGLPPIVACADPAALDEAVPSEADEEAVADVRAQLERAAARTRLHSYTEALAMVEALAPRLESIEYPPLHAEYLHARGRALDDADELEPAAEAYHDALMKAQALGMDARVRDVAADLSMLLGSRLAKPEQGLPWADLAEATDERLGPTPVTQSKLLRNRAWILVAWGMKPDAIAVVERAYEAAQQAYAPDDFQMIQVYSSLGAVYAQLGQLEEARGHFERVVELTELTLGTDHPSLLGSYRNLGNLMSALREADEAEPFLRRAAALTERIPGVSDDNKALIASALGNNAMARGDFEYGFEQHQQALALRERIYGPEHPMVARSLNSLAGAASRIDRIDDAIGWFRQSLAIREKSVGPEHVSLMTPLGNLGVMLAEHERYEEALPLFERSYALMQEHGDRPGRAAQHNFWFGRSLVETEQDVERGMTLVRDSVAQRETLGGGFDLELAHQWLKARTEG